MKLRLLNGAHSSLAYLGYLAGYETVSEVMADPAFERFVRGLMEEATPTFPPPPSADLRAYKAALIERFENPALKHRTWQICMDGSQKLPQRLLGTIRDCLKLGAPFDRLALGVAAWMRYVTGIDEKGEAIDVRDPLAAKTPRDRRRRRSLGRKARAGAARSEGNLRRRASGKRALPHSGRAEPGLPRCRWRATDSRRSGAAGLSFP